MRPGLTGAAALVPALLLSGCSNHATAAGSPAPTVRTLTGRQGPSTTLDLGARGESVGDEQIETGTLLEGTTTVGTQAFTCQTLARARAQESLHCRVELVLHDGQLIAEGLAVFSRAGNDVTLAVTGGTSAYRTARGELVVHPGDTDFGFQLTLAR